MKKRDYLEIAKDVIKAQNSDSDAMNRILADVQDAVYYNCLRMLRSEQAAQDATQDILITVYQKLGTLSDPQAYMGWVKCITANHCKQRLLKVNKEFLLSENEDGEDPFANFEDTDEQRIPDKALDNEETRRMINELVDRLPDEQRMCVMLYYYDEMKTREIADALNVSEGTIKSRLNYARKSIKEGVKVFEKQGVKLYGASPIPFLTYFLAKSASGVSAPIAAASIATAATATAATAATATAATAATATAATASSGIAAFFATTAGKVAVAVAIAAAVGGVGTGVVLATQKPAEPAVVEEETAIPSAAYTPTTIATPEATPVPTPVYALVPTSEIKTPEETLQALTGFSEEESVYILDSLRTILAGENEIDYINNSPVAEIWEIHSLQTYAPNGEKHEKPDRYIALELLPCYGVRLEDETILHVYLWEGVTEHDWIICRVLLVSAGSFLKEPKLSEWSLELPPEDALDVEERPQVHIRMKCEDSAFPIDPNTDDYDVHNYGVFSYGMTDHYTANIVEINRDWQLLGEYDSVDGFTDKTEGDWQVFYKYEWDEGTGKYTVWVKEHYYVMHFIFYTAWSDWEDGTEPRYSPFYYFPGVGGEMQYQPSFAVQTENRTWYRYLQ